ncbi:MAG: acyl-CoA dehydrogenase family protein, partial [Solirubrobacterales bacterium]
MTLTTQAPASIETTALPLELTPELSELRERARRFVDEVLIPLEQDAERAGGRLPQETIDRIKREGIAARLNGGLHSPDYGGQGWSRLEWALVEEQFGRSTNGIYWHIPNAYNVWDHASEAQRERYLRPAIAGELKDAYAVTEAGAGSDPSRIETTAERTDAGYRINGEKWFVTTGDVAKVLIVMANVADGPKARPTLFLVSSDAPGVEYVDDPGFTHNYPEGHPTIRFNAVEVADDGVVGEVGAGNDL